MKELSSMTVGIRFNKAFRVLDEWGYIVDSILYDPCDSSFDTAYFPQISGAGYEKALINNETGNSLRLTSDNLVYTHFINDKMNGEDERKKMIVRINKCLAPKVIDYFGLPISRLGVIYTVDIEKEEYNKFKNMYFKDSIENISAFRFSIKTPLTKGNLPSGVNDYYNKIFTVQNNGQSYSISYDYQLYFNPSRGCWYDSKHESFFADSWMGLRDDIFNCIGSD